MGDEKFEAEFLGRGHYCTAYRRGDVVYCFVTEGEYMKDVIYEQFDHEKPTPHIPAIDRHAEQFTRGKYLKVYSMPFYPNATAKDKDAWPVLVTLRKAAERIFSEKYGWKAPLAVNGAYFNRDIIEATRGEVPESVSEALQELADAAGNYGCGVSFEFGRRNIGVDTQGRIVFRDILFDAEKIEREWTAKIKAARGY